MNYYKNIRLKNYDYHTGWFFITNTSNLRKSLFEGNIRDLIKYELIHLAEQTKGVGIDYFHIMPNHIHAILIFDNAQFPLSEFWRRFKAITSLKAKKLGYIQESLWQKNYYEHTIRSEKALFAIRKYIENNPLKESLPLEEIYQEVHVQVR